MGRAAGTLLLAACLAVLTACGNDDDEGAPVGDAGPTTALEPDAGALAAGFAEPAAAAYEAEGRDRGDEEDTLRGVVVTSESGCIALDEDRAAAIAEAAGLAHGSSGFGTGILQGEPDVSERVTCTMIGDDEALSVGFGTTPYDLEETEASLRRGPHYGSTEVRVDVPGLPDDEVLLLHEEDEGVIEGVWVKDGFTVGVHLGFDEDRDPKRAAEALAAAVQQVSEALTG